MKQTFVRVLIAGALALAPLAASANTSKLPHDHTPVARSHAPTMHSRVETIHH